ncbi:MAG TPA: ImmA/IrrE family metallo-endopeptidase [Candidatus Cybelea sp.]|nr:ImmA/IrrE family metallo-endopeptidase [Candidatus Cybelea sp.]
MNALLRACRAYGVRVCFADLGNWGRSELRAEYDPQAREIRIHRDLASALVARAIAHELYHHREAMGEIVVLPSRAQREAAAQEYARRLCGGTA